MERKHTSELSKCSTLVIEKIIIELGIRFNFEALPSTSQNMFKSQLISYLSKINEQTEKETSTNLYLALINLILHMPTWENAVVDLIDNFSQISKPVKLEILTLLPKDLRSRLKEMSEKQKARVEEILCLSTTKISSFLDSCLSDAEADVAYTKKIIECHNSWGLNSVIFVADSSQNQIVTKVLNVLHQSSPSETSSDFFNLHKAAAHCLINTVYSSDVDNCFFCTLGKFCNNNIWTLKTPYYEYLKRGDNERMLNYSHIFVKFAQDQLKAGFRLDQCYRSSSYFENVLDGMVLISSERYAELTFPFWNLLSNIIFVNRFVDPAYLFGSYIERMVLTLPQRCKINDDFQGLLEETDEIYKFRHQVSQLINNIYFLFNKDTVFQKICFELQAPGADWNDIEAHLFIMEKIVNNVNLNHEPFLEIIKKLLTTWKDVHETVTWMTVLIFKKLSEWIAKCSSFLHNIVEFLIQCLYKDGVQKHAAFAIQEICLHAKEELDVFVHIFYNVLQNADASTLDNEVVLDVYKAVTYLISCLPTDSHYAKDAFKTICDLATQPLLQLIEDGQSDFVENTKTDPTFWLIRLAIILETIKFKENNLYNHVFSHIFQILCQVMERYYSREEVIEQISDMISVIWKNVYTEDPEILNQFIEKLASLYCNSSTLGFLEMANNVVTNFHTNSTLIPHLLDMFSILVDRTESLLNKQYSIDYQCNLIEHFFLLSLTIVECNNLQFLQWSKFEEIVAFTISTNAILYRFPTYNFINTVYFFYRLFLFGRMTVFEESRSRVYEFFLRYGLALSTVMFKYCILTDHPVDIRYAIASVIIEMLNLNRTLARDWFKVTLESLCYTNNEANDANSFNGKIKVIRLLCSQTRMESVKNGIDRLRELYL